MLRPRSREAEPSPSGSRILTDHSQTPQTDRSGRHLNVNHIRFASRERGDDVDSLRVQSGRSFGILVPGHTEGE